MSELNCAICERAADDCMNDPCHTMNYRQGLAEGAMTAATKIADWLEEEGVLDGYYTDSAIKTIREGVWM